MNKRLTAVFLSVLALGCVSAFSFANESIPKFTDFPVNDVFTGKHAKLAKGVDKHFAKVLAEPVNFAGHYIVYHEACGGGCIMGGIMDAKKGVVVESFPDEYVVDSFESEYKIDSRLLVITGESATKDTGVQTRFYKLENDKLKILKVIKVK
jgi:hypothetical protein